MSRTAEGLEPDLFSAVEAIASSVPEGVPLDVCLMFEQLAVKVAAKGFTRYSARAIAHRMRWEEQIEKGNREFKVNNIWTPALARWFLAKHPELPGFFELRESGED